MSGNWWIPIVCGACTIGLLALGHMGGYALGFLRGTAKQIKECEKHYKASLERRKRMLGGAFDHKAFQKLFDEFEGREQ